MGRNEEQGLPSHQTPPIRNDTDPLLETSGNSVQKWVHRLASVTGTIDPLRKTIYSTAETTVHGQFLAVFHGEYSREENFLFFLFRFCRIVIMDQRDEDILRELLRNGRVSNAALARAVGLSESATLERVRRLEAEGAIQGYMARVEPTTVGRGLEAIIAIQLSHHQEDEVERFKEVLSGMEEVLSCFAVAGRYDFIAHVAVHNMEDFEKVVARRLMRLRAIERIETLFILSALKRDGPLTPWRPDPAS